MTIKFIPYVKSSPYERYTEVGQTNNLRWTYLYRNDDGSFQEQTMMFKCKDFFNDVVAKYHGKEVSVYGMDTNNLKLNEEGLYVKLKFVAPMFIENVGSINSYAAEWAMPPISAELAGVEDGESRALLFIPREYFDNTYFISLLTYLIRVSNINTEITSFANHPTRRQDDPFKEWYDKVIKEGFVLPMTSPDGFYVKTNDQWLDGPTKIHNCGCATWHQMARYHTLKKEGELV